MMPGAIHERLAGKTARSANLSVRHDAKSQLKSQALHTASQTESIPPGTAPAQLMSLVFESEHKSVRKQAFDRLVNAGCVRELEKIADSDSVYARSARAELDRKNDLDWD
jgi:acetyl-CoA acetyltransferase